jgi:undecaprenyl-diphosphatase
LTLYLLLFLALLQGLTEFLPVSSSGHLVLARALAGDPGMGQDLTVEIALHVGTLGAVLVYFRRELAGILAGLLRPAEAGSSRGGREWRLALYLLVGTVPAGLAGTLLGDLVEEAFARPGLAGTMLLVTAGGLWSTRWIPEGRIDETRMGVGRALLVGVAQSLALLPGISRSGATLVAGLALGLEREAAFRFSFLLSVPAIAGAAILQGLRLLRSGVGTAALGPSLLGAMFLAGLVGYACLVILRRALVGRRLHWFAVYCALAGAVGLALGTGS